MTMVNGNLSMDFSGSTVKGGISSILSPNKVNVN